MIGVLAPASYVSYNLLALLCCAALLPLTLTRWRSPRRPAPRRACDPAGLALSPLAVAGVIVAGVSGASFRMVGPLYGTEVGLAADQIALFLAAFVLGGALAQWPAGWAADRHDRRWVLIWFSALSIMACGVTVTASGLGVVAVFLSALVFGATSFPIYSISAAHAHDWATDDQRVELSAALMFFYALGAIAAPLATSADRGLRTGRALCLHRGGPCGASGLLSRPHVRRGPDPPPGQRASDACGNGNAYRRPRPRPDTGRVRGSDPWRARVAPAVYLAGTVGRRPAGRTGGVLLFQRQLRRPRRRHRSLDGRKLRAGLHGPDRGAAGPAGCGDRGALRLAVVIRGVGVFGAELRASRPPLVRPRSTPCRRAPDTSAVGKRLWSGVLDRWHGSSSPRRSPTSTGSSIWATSSAASLPADLYARYMRARGHEVLFLCATDEHGTPAELAAAKAGKPVAEYCAEMWGAGANSAAASACLRPFRALVEPAEPRADPAFRGPPGGEAG
jgi:hypothetical protein